MPSPQIFFRVEHSVAKDLKALAVRFGTTPGRIARLIILREISQLPALLDQHDLALKEIQQFHRDLVATLEDYLEETGDPKKGSGIRRVMLQLNEQSQSIDALRSAATPRPSSYIAKLVRLHDQEPIQTSIPY